VAFWPVFDGGSIVFSHIDKKQLRMPARNRHRCGYLYDFEHHTRGA
jgi:hypothetical protein